MSIYGAVPAKPTISTSIGVNIAPRHATIDRVTPLALSPNSLAPPAPWARIASVVSVGLADA